MLVAFEGIDGSGKTTLSNLVAGRLRAAGREVVHAREHGVLGSGVARRVRELTRDAGLLEMGARAELFLNLAREAQQLDEIVRPALARGALVIADRSLHSLVALSCAGRGLARDEVEAAVRAAAAGTWPDLVLLVDVDPDLARMRKRIGKILERREREAESRKGLAGAGLQARVRRHLLAEARANPGRWIVAQNEGRSLEALADELAAAILRRAEGDPAPAPAALDASPPRVAAAFLAALEALAPSEPGLAAYLLTGIPGEVEHAWRVALASRAPALVARSLHGLSDRRSFELRRALAPVVPEDVAASLAGERSGEAAALREALLDAAPSQVVAALAGDGTPEAWALRERALRRGALGDVVASLGGLDEPRAWALRDEAVRGERWRELGRSLAGVAGPRADALREALSRRDRLAALAASAGTDGALQRELRERLFPHAAKPVLRSLWGVEAPYAWALRERALPATKEALDSVDGMDHPRAWALREAGVALWPATAVSSLRDLAGTLRGSALVARALRAAPPGSLRVLRNAHAVFARAALARAAAAREAGTEREVESCSI